MKILAIVQNWNENDPQLGFIVGWMDQLASQSDQLIILALEQHQPPTAPNITVYSLGKEKYRGWASRFYYLCRWHKQMKKIIALHSPDVIFTHMTPIYSVLAYPYAVDKNIPIITWFLHPHRSWTFMLAHFLSKKVVSATINSYPYKKDKLIAIGHGINTRFFYNQKTELACPPLLLCVGRISAVKDYLTLFRAVSLIKNEAGILKLWLVGNISTKDDVEYAKNLNAAIIKMRLQDIVVFKPAVAPKNLADFYRSCTIFLNPTPSGSMDKAVLEAMACGKPVLVASENFREILGIYADQLLFRFGDEIDLGHKLLRLLQLSQNEKEKIGVFLQQKVMTDWSLNALATKLVGVFQSVISK